MSADENLDQQEVVDVFLRRVTTAVEFYIRLGTRLYGVIGQLDYPTKNALRGWYREYVRGDAVDCSPHIASGIIHECSCSPCLL